MAYIAELTLENWGPYQGTHTIQLEAGVYGVVCRYKDDPTRSNWGGKSWFLQAARYALLGIPPKECRVEDEYITRGESECRVEVVLSDGFRIKRGRKLGASTKLSVWRSKRAKVATQKRAQELIDDELLKMTQKELEAGAFTEQRDVARFVLAVPGEKTAIVEGWLKLSPLKAAEKFASGQLDKATSIYESLCQERLSLAEGYQLEDIRPQLVAEVVEAHEAAKEALAAAADPEHLEHAKRAARYDEVVAEGQGLAFELEGAECPELTPFEDSLSDARARAEQAVETAAGLNVVVGERFDGTCPLTCDKCPVPAAKIRKRQEQRTGTLAAAIEERDGAKDQAAIAQEELDGAVASADAVTAMERTLEALRGEAAKLEPSVDYINEHGEPPDPSKIVQLTNAVVDSASERKEMEDQQEVAQEVADAQAELDPKIEQAQKAVAIYRDAARIIATTRRSIALRALKVIEAGANGMLTESGIDLQVEAQWERPAAKGLATQCRQCGAPYPASQKVKTCETCGAVRGPKIIEQLELVSTARSGAADDSVGLAFRLAAAAWLRRQRGSEWGVVSIDEPFGQLDSANRDALASHLHGLLRGQLDFEQGFIVAHDASIMDAMPQRVVVCSNGTHASLEVE